MYNYCIVYEGQYCESYSYVTKSDIVELARYINEQTLADRKRIVKNVYLTSEYFNLNLNSSVRCFFPTEYNEQFFLESYQARLLEKYRMEKLAI